MKHEKQKYYDSILEQNKITEDLLLAIVAVNEPKISKAAYSLKKFGNTEGYGYNFIDTAKYELQKHIGVRNDIYKALKCKYTQAQVKSMATKVNKDDFPAQRIVDVVLELLKSGNYTIMSADS